MSLMDDFSGPRSNATNKRHLIPSLSGSRNSPSVLVLLIFVEQWFNALVLLEARQLSRIWNVC